MSRAFKSSISISRQFTFGKLSKSGEKLRVLESTFASISGILLGGFKHYFGHKLKSFVVVAGERTKCCCIPLADTYISSLLFMLHSIIRFVNVHMLGYNKLSLMDSAILQ